MTELLLRLFVKNYKNTKDESVREKYGLLGSLFGLVSNLLLFLLKIVIGFMMGLFSVIADSVNNLSDFGNNALSIFGIKVGSKKADTDHPFGHQRMEYIISLVISCVIIALGCIMLYQGALDCYTFINTLVETGEIVTEDIAQNEFIVTVVLLSIAILVKVMQSSLYYSLGRRISSIQLRALGRDALNDVISTSTVIVGIVITFTTGYGVDFAFTLFVSVMVIISGIGILKDSANILLGEKPGKEVIDSLVSLIRSHEGVLGLHDLTMHTYGRIIFAVIHVEVDANVDILISHELSDTIEKEAKDKLGINLTIHIDPIIVDDEETSILKKNISLALREYNSNLSLHDFRAVKAEKFINAIFDVVIPSEIDDDIHKDEIIAHLKNKVKEDKGREINYVINFDDSNTDFLYDKEKTVSN